MREQIHLLLVKLRHQVDEATCGALEQGTQRLLLVIEELEEGADLCAKS